MKCAEHENLASQEMQCSEEDNLAPSAAIRVVESLNDSYHLGLSACSCLFKSSGPLADGRNLIYVMYVWLEIEKIVSSPHSNYEQSG